MDDCDDSSTLAPLLTIAIVLAPSSLLSASSVAALEEEAESSSSKSEFSTGVLSNDKPSSDGLENAWLLHNTDI